MLQIGVRTKYALNEHTALTKPCQEAELQTGSPQVLLELLKILS